MKTKVYPRYNLFKKINKLSLKKVILIGSIGFVLFIYWGYKTRYTANLKEKLFNHIKNEQDFQHLEDIINKKPGDEKILKQLMDYSEKGQNNEKLKQYTLEMVKYHPGNPSIYFNTRALFYTEPKFRDMVINLLEKKLSSRTTDQAALFWNLAQIYKRKAVPPFPKNATQKQKLRWYKRVGISPIVNIPTAYNHKLIKKAERYYRKAIELSKGDAYHYSMYLGTLAKTLAELGREEEAITLYEKAISSAPSNYKEVLIKKLQKTKATSSL